MMATKESLSHNLGGGMSRRAESNGWNGVELAENIAYGSDTASGTFRQWMTSPGHRANILDRSTDLCGFGHAVSGRGEQWWAANYGAKQAGGTGGGDGQPAPKRRWWQIIFRLFGA
jgi:uncharacterized protein YkwD